MEVKTRYERIIEGNKLFSLDNNNNLKHNGGAGSGNWGHSGRQGKIGGSARTTSQSTPQSTLQSILHKINRKNHGKRLRELAEVFKAHNVAGTKGIKEVFGEQFKGYKGKEAINKLLKEKRGYVPNAFYRSDIGGIYLAWGENDEKGHGYGLKHIIGRREKERINIDDFLDELTDVIETGDLRCGEDGKFKIFKNRKMAIIGKRYDLKNRRIRHVITSYINKKV